LNLQSLFPRASSSFLDLNRSISSAKPEHKDAESLGETVPGKEKGMGRVTLRITGFLVRPQDPDNFAAANKDIIDGLRRCGLIHGDEPWRIKLITEQERVAHFIEERLEVKITWPK
jgi:hypothetical protein